MAQPWQRLFDLGFDLGHWVSHALTLLVRKSSRQWIYFTPQEVILYSLSKQYSHFKLTQFLAIKYLFNTYYAECRTKNCRGPKDETNPRESFYEARNVPK